MELEGSQVHQFFLTRFMSLHGNIHCRMVVLINQCPILIHISVLLLDGSTHLAVILIVAGSVVDGAHDTLDRGGAGRLVCFSYFDLLFGLG